MDEVISLGIMTIATNSYVNYWKQQAKSISLLNHTGIDVTLHVFTDDVPLVREFSRDLDLRVVTHHIPSYGWPEATLYRYAIFNQFKQDINEQILMYLDADMLVNRGFTYQGLTESMRSGVCLVMHPGYYRPSGFSLLELYFNNTSLARGDLSALVSKGGIGEWEQNRDSLAFVPRRLRKRYMCGGIWWGFREEIFSLCYVLASRVLGDEANGEQAVWHDESHLNWWASRNSSGVESPRYCFAEGYPQLKNLENFVTAVEKERKS
jgi:hypothetical protein